MQLKKIIFALGASVVVVMQGWSAAHMPEAEEPTAIRYQIASQWRPYPFDHHWGDIGFPADFGELKEAIRSVHFGLPLPKDFDVVVTFSRKMDIGTEDDLVKFKSPSPITSIRIYARTQAPAGGEITNEEIGTNFPRKSNEEWSEYGDLGSLENVRNLFLSSYQARMRALTLNPPPVESGDLEIKGILCASKVVTSANFSAVFKLEPFKPGPKSMIGAVYKPELMPSPLDKSVALLSIAATNLERLLALQIASMRATEAAGGSVLKGTASTLEGVPPMGSAAVSAPKSSAGVLAGPALITTPGPTPEQINAAVAVLRAAGLITK